MRAEGRVVGWGPAEGPGVGVLWPSSQGEGPQWGVTPRWPPNGGRGSETTPSPCPDLGEEVLEALASPTPRHTENAFRGGAPKEVHTLGGGRGARGETESGPYTCTAFLPVQAPVPYGAHLWQDGVLRCWCSECKG